MASRFIGEGFVKVYVPFFFFGSCCSNCFAFCIFITLSLVVFICDHYCTALSISGVYLIHFNVVTS